MIRSLERVKRVLLFFSINSSSLHVNFRPLMSRVMTTLHMSSFLCISD